MKIPKSFLILITPSIFLYLAAYFFVNRYYSVGLPYYDSVGSYWNMFAVMNETSTHGIVSGVIQAAEYSLSWLQSFFAVAASFVLPKTPQALIILNFLTLCIAQWSIYRYAYAYKMSKIRITLLPLLPLLPGSLWSWYGGYIDMRRDVSFVSLLTAIFFTLSAYLHKPNVFMGIAAGVLMGLTQWSRGNSAPYIMIVFLSVLIGYAYPRNKRNFTSTIKVLILPCISALFLLIPFYLVNTQAILTKYLHGSWALGENRINSIGYVIGTLPMLILGNSKAAAKVSVYFLIFLIIIISVAWKARVFSFVKFPKHLKPIAIAGTFIILATLLFNSLILGFNRFAGTLPNYPVLVGAYAVTIVLFSRLRFKFSFRVSVFTLILFFASIIILNTMRIFKATPQGDPVRVQLAKKVANDLSVTLSGYLVSYLWVDHINVHDLNFYLTQLGSDPIIATSGLAPGADTEMPSDPHRTIDKQRDDFARAIRTRPYIVVTDEMSAYENTSAQFFLFRFGRPVIKDILSDSQLIKIYTFNDGLRNYYVLKNQIEKDREEI